MPPWLPAPGDVAFAGDRSLTAAERRAITGWVASGMPAGDLVSTPVADSPTGWALGEPDLVLATVDPYPVPAAGGDIFRNLVVPASIERRRWVRGIDVRFSEPSAVHHAMIALDPSASSRRQDARDPLPGFDGMFTATEALGPSGFLVGWTHGRAPELFPDGLAFPIDPGTDFVLQLHVRPSGEAKELGAELGVYLTDSAPTRTPFTIRLGAEEIDIAPGDTYVETDEYVLPVDVQLLALYPHAHYVGRRITLVAVLPDSSRIDVLDIPDWDFNWQDAYRLAAPLRLPAGSRLEAAFEYDNSASNPRNPRTPPERVLYGPSSLDEMGEIWIQVVPERGEELERLVTDFGRKNLRSSIEGWTHRLRVSPAEPTALAGLGTVAQARGDHAEAVELLGRALASRPDHVVARYNLGVSLEALGRLDEAERAYREVIRVEPEYSDAHNNLGIMEASRGRLAAAVGHFEAAVWSDGRNARARNNLGNALRQRGDLAGAAAHLERALGLAPDSPDARRNLALVAWSLATDPDPAVRNGPEAQRLAARAASGPFEDDPRFLDVLAAAHAEAGEFDAATDVATRAERRAAAGGASLRSLLGDIRQRLSLYRQGRPFHAPIAEIGGDREPDQDAPTPA
jgi:Flp pilus assembly protein TadD